MRKWQVSHSRQPGKHGLCEHMLTGWLATGIAGRNGRFSRPIIRVQHSMSGHVLTGRLTSGIAGRNGRFSRPIIRV
ncbi:hypothetical protein AALG83_08880 [Christensenellaceae bacterium 44-20]